MKTSYRFFLKNENEIACMGQELEQSLHFVQRERLCCAKGSCKSISSLQTLLQMLQSDPFVVFKHLFVSILGLKKRFKRLIIETKAPRGQNFLHVKRKKTSSSANTAGKTNRDHVGSLNCISLHALTMTANVNPTGQMRQNTGKPNNKVEPKAPPNT